MIAGETSASVSRTAPADRPVLVAGRPRTDAEVAVCVPVYQGGEHLGDTLRSVLAQSFGEFELVVLDNASTDATAAVLAGFDDERMTVWRNPRTVPMAVNFNRVVGLSHAPLVKLLPADDVLEPSCLALAVAALTRDPGLAVVGGRAHLVDDRGTVLARRRFVRGLAGTRERDAVVRRVVRSGANPVGGDLSLTFRRSAFVAAGGYSGVELHGDVELALRMLRHGRFRGLRETVARFRVAPGTMTATVSPDAEAAQQAWARHLAASEPAVRRRDRLVGRAAAPWARARRLALFGLVRLAVLGRSRRHRPDGGSS